MKQAIFKYLGVFIIITMFCLAPLGAIDLDDNNNTYINQADNESASEDANIIADDEKNKDISIGNDTETVIAGDEKNKDIADGNDSEAQEDINSSDDLKNSSIDYASLHVNDIMEGETAHIEIRSDFSVNSDVEVCVNNNHTTIRMENGYASLDVSGLTPDIYKVTVLVMGIEVTNTTTFKVNPKADPQLSVHVPDANPAEDAIAEISLNKNYTGNVTVKCDGVKIQTVTIRNGHGYVGVGNDLLPGEHTVEVNSSANRGFIASEAKTKFNVSKVPTIYGFANSILDDEPLYVQIRTASQYNGLIICSLEDGSVQYGYAQNGLFSCKFDQSECFTSGFHNVHIMVFGDSVFSLSERNITFHVR